MHGAHHFRKAEDCLVNARQFEKNSDTDPTHYLANQSLVNQAMAHALLALVSAVVDPASLRKEGVRW